ncbi:hypothetical protein [Pedobacter sp. CFBP9032]|uniref:hypothetical protein n=1 Tax=Pedobacter sp. CFBP9032 TaxID=3096539 RepID=UPI002A6A9C83|nr:hypothetical protein [Pedobacter sp. CFBP9032]MDY0905629.1 hypothetical protein [Pedobacter sp. CFBP9032]
MKNNLAQYTIAICLILSCLSCHKIRGWFSGYDEATPQNPIQQTGCSKDVVVHYKNNCNSSLLLYYKEFTEGDSFKCEDLTYYGTLNIGDISAVTIHKGKSGYFVFATNKIGKCTGGDRKSEYWFRCSANITLDDSNFNTCN